MFNLDFLKNKNGALIGIGVIAVVVVAILIYSNPGDTFSLSGIFGTSDQQIGEKAVKYINDKQLSEQPATLVSVYRESGLVRVKIKIGSQEFDSYATRDGRFLFPSALDMAPKESGSSVDNNTDLITSTSVTKTDSPLLEVFVVSRCPYGLQIQRAVADAVKNMPDLAKYIKLEYMGSVSGNTITSMHGDAEATENLRQICIREEQPTKYWNYVACQMKAGDTAGCQASVGIDSAKLNTCISDSNKGIAYAQKDFDQSSKYNVGGSPTLVLNGTTISESDFGGRSSDGIKSMVCAGFNTQPSFCSITLNETPAASSFSETYAGSGSSGNSGTNGTNCAPAQ